MPGFDRGWDDGFTDHKGIKMKKAENKQIAIYQTSTGALELKTDIAKETIWATQAQIAEVFRVERSVITKHICNILKDKELDEKQVCAKFAHTAADGKTYNVQHYNLDIILAVGYRTNSGRAISFRQWATKILKEHIVNGYTINKKRIAKNYDSFIKAVENVRALLPSASSIDNASILELIKFFADTWFSLAAYDKNSFNKGKITRRKVNLAAAELSVGVAQLKMDLKKKGEASDLFALERGGSSLEGILGNVMQTFGGKDLYPSLEEKAAHLLYFIVKNHPFADGNKRSGAFAFVWFLRRTGRLNIAQLTPSALTALTLLIAESHPKDKDKMTGLVAMLLSV
ncbi:MAG TPA: virulence protein RhuM/Fic/DOC family protein [Patescibacteria group bacterium]|nr:virulence protein RhuM/Fic/DOC family protein [Patescibacteria group bacterium]